MTAFALNESQRLAVKHRDGPLMVLAGPGSGKTTVITYRTLYLIEKHRIPPRNILVITYSKAAAEQMRKRFLALAGNQPVTFGTFHAVFFRILRERYRYTLDRIVKEDERRNMIKKALSEMRYDLGDEFVSAVLNELSLAKNELFDLKYYHSASIAAEDFITLFERYEDYKREQDKIDFDDMLCLCHKLFTEEPDVLNGWRQRFTHIMIDEFQDINRAQYECVRMLAEPLHNLFIVGDDDQSIYRFRGAKPEFLLHFPEDYPSTGQVLLDVNYRSTDPIIEYAGRLIKENRVRYPKEIVGTDRDGMKPLMLTEEDQNLEATVISKRIKELQKKGADLNEIAIIYRVNLQARAFTDTFLHHNIPYQVKDEAPTLYEHWIAKDLLAYLSISQGLSKGYDPEAERIINKPYRYIGKAFLKVAKRNGLNIFDAYARDETLHVAQRARVEELWFYIQAIRKRVPVEAVRYARQAVGYDQHIRDYCQYRRLDPTGLFEVADELQEAAKQFKTIAEFLAHAEEAVLVSKQNKQPRGPCVTLTTMHSAKGLEFDTVFVVGAVDGIIPHERSKTDAELEEERRLLYVGVTRAKNTLYVSMPRMRYDKPVKPSRFLAE